ncbi:MAG: response regulator [Anaerolineae bacterium]|nr:response regulator [Anaerolineae bacterium]
MTKILSLHAESDILNLLHIILERAGYEHLFTTHAETALSILQSEKIDLFIQNLMRSDINGCEFYDIMQDDEKLLHIPVLIISAINPLTYPEICFRIIQNLYPDHYLLLPFSPQVLLSAINRILSKATPQ